jgi:hypothetical protein
MAEKTEPKPYSVLYVEFDERLVACLFFDTEGRVISRGLAIWSNQPQKRGIKFWLLSKAEGDRMIEQEKPNLQRAKDIAYGRAMKAYKLMQKEPGPLSWQKEMVHNKHARRTIISVMKKLKLRHDFWFYWKMAAYPTTFEPTKELPLVKERRRQIKSMSRWVQEPNLKGFFIKS